MDTLTDISYTGRADTNTLRAAVAAVFEPSGGRVSRAVGHPAAPLTVEVVTELVEVRLTAVARVQNGEVTDEEMRQARHAHHVAFTEYVAQQPEMAAASSPAHRHMYERLRSNRP